MYVEHQCFEHTTPYTLPAPPENLPTLILEPNLSSHPLTLSHSISGSFTAALMLYSGTFMRYALAVQPKNYLLFGCHVVNFGAQATQGARWYTYWYMGGRANAKQITGDLEGKGRQIGEQVEGAFAQAKGKAEEVVKDVKGKVQ
jgi:hypothetical protein